MRTPSICPLTPEGGKNLFPTIFKGEEVKIPPLGVRGLFVVVGFLVFLSSCSKPEKTTKAEYQELIEAVYASGSILPRHEYKVFSLADGIISEKIASEGDLVKTGQLLFRVESEAQDARLQNAQAAYQLAQSNLQANSPVLNELGVVLENARIKLKNDSMNFSRYKNLYENQASSKVDYDRAWLTYQTAQNDFQAKKNNYNKIKNDLYLNLQNAQSQYTINAKDESNYLITSRIEGRVYEVYKEQGEVVRRNDVVALLGDDKAVYLKLSVDELDIPKVKIGQEIIVKIDVYKDKVFKAKVSKIYPRLNSADQSFRVDAEFVGESPANFSGLSIEANIIIQKKNRTLTIAKSLIFNGDTIIVKRNGKTEKVKIKKGLETLDKVEILSGISEKDEIIF